MLCIHHQCGFIWVSEFNTLRHLFSIGNSTPAKVVRLHHPNRLFCWPHTKLSFCIVQDLAKKKNRITVFSTSKWKVLHRCPSICVAKLKSKAKPKNRRRVGTLLDSEAINKIWTMLLACMAGVKRVGEKGRGEWGKRNTGSFSLFPVALPPSPPLLLLASATRATMLCTPNRARFPKGRLTRIQD